MATYTIDINDQVDKVLRAMVEDPVEWVEHALTNKARRGVDEIIKAKTNLNPAKMSDADRLGYVSNLTFESYSEERQKKSLRK